MQVVKRNGELVEFDQEKFARLTKFVGVGLDGVDTNELLEETQIAIYNGIKTKDILKLYESTASSKIDVQCPNWSFVAARVLLFDMYKQIGDHTKYPPLKEYFKRGYEHKRIIEGLDELFDLDKLDKAIDMERDKLFNYLALKTLIDKYILKDYSKNIIELPQHMWMGISMFLASAYRHTGKYDINDLAIEFYNTLSTLKFMLATPILANARTPKHQLSSCYVGTTDDSIEGIFDSFKDMALISKYGGGIGWDFGNIRSIGADIRGFKGVAGGLIPWLKITNDVAIAVDQLGTRKGSIAVYIEPWHADILDFLDLRKNSGEERRRTHDLFPALWIPDLFMERILEDGEWTLFSPNEVPELHNTWGKEFEDKYKEYEKDESKVRGKINAKTLWKQILVSYFETGLPFLTFKDTANALNPNKHEGIIYSSNLCTEIFQNTKPGTYNTNAELINARMNNKEEITIREELPNIVETNLLNKDHKKDVKDITTLDRITLEKSNTHTEPIDEMVDTQRWLFSKKPTNGEMAVCNLGSINLSKTNKEEDIKEVTKAAVLMLNAVLDLNYIHVKDALHGIMNYRPIGIGLMGEAEFIACNKIHFGSMEHKRIIHETMEMISYYTIDASCELAKSYKPYKMFKGSDWEKGIYPHDYWDATRFKKNYELTDNLPLKMDWNSLKEKVKKFGLRNGYLFAIAPTSNISILSSTTQTIEPIYSHKWMEENSTGMIPVVVPNLTLETINYYKSAYNIDQMRLVELAAIRQRFIDQGQSLNLFFKVENVSAKQLHLVYTRAWELGLKSTYYLRSESMEVKDGAIDRSMECEGCQ